MDVRSGALLLVCAALLLFLLQAYLFWRSPVFLFGVAAAISVASCDSARKQGRRYAYAAIVLALFNILLPVKTILYMSLVCGILFTLENFRGKTGPLPLMVALLVSPAFQYVSDVFTFPVRLELSRWAGSALQLAGGHVRTEGNLIFCNGDEFSVDPACMGLNMMITSLVAGVLLISFYQKRLHKRVSPWLLILLLGCIAGLNVVSNLIRIILLVQFRILPQTMLHEVAGLLCFAAYVLLPGAFLCRWIIARWAGAAGKEGTVSPVPVHRSQTIFYWLVAGCLILSGLVVARHEMRMGTPAQVSQVPGYAARRIDDQIIKLENGRSLVYLKKISGFYAAEHNPLICWRGSGYVFSQISEQVVGATTVYSGVLQKGDERLYTIWWYANGRHNTIRQLNWRWHMLKGEPAYSIVNITCNTEEQVRAEAEKVLQTRCFQSLLQ